MLSDDSQRIRPRRFRVILGSYNSLCITVLILLEYKKKGTKKW